MGAAIGVVLSVGLMAAVATFTNAVTVHAGPSPLIGSSSTVQYEDVAVVAASATTATIAPTASTQTTAPLDLGSDAGSSPGGGTSIGTVALIVIGGLLVATIVAAALIGRRRRRRT
jgi:hypothetical protein